MFTIESMSPHLQQCQVQILVPKPVHPCNNLSQIFCLRFFSLETFSDKMKPWGSGPCKHLHVRRLPPVPLRFNFINISFLFVKNATSAFFRNCYRSITGLPAICSLSLSPTWSKIVTSRFDWKKIIVFPFPRCLISLFHCWLFLAGNMFQQNYLKWRSFQINVLGVCFTDFLRIFKTGILFLLLSRV